MILSIPLALLQLTHNKLRFCTTIIGLAFIVNLFFLQLGFHDALFDSSLRVYKALQGDIFLISPQYQSITSQQPFSRMRLYQALALDSVKSISPLYLKYGKLKNIDNGRKFSILVLGIDPGKPTLNLDEVQQNINQLKISNQALFDRASRSEFGPIAERFNQGLNVNIEIAPYNEIIAAKNFKIVGLYTIGTSFGIDGSLIINYTDALLAFPGSDADKINLGLIILQPNTDIQKAINTLKVTLPNDVKILTRQQLYNLEKEYWSLRTPIGFSFKLMLTMGFIVGMGIIYEILTSLIASNLKTYGTLKAMGYHHQYFFKIVFQQALILATLSYILGLILALPLYQISREVTRLPVIITIDKCLYILLFTLIMCSLSGILAIQKTQKADPADIF